MGRTCTARHLHVTWNGH